MIKPTKKASENAPSTSDGASEKTKICLGKWTAAKANPVKASDTPSLFVSLTKIDSITPAKVNSSTTAVTPAIPIRLTSNEKPLLVSNRKAPKYISPPNNPQPKAGRILPAKSLGSPLRERRHQYSGTNQIIGLNQSSVTTSGKRTK